MLPGLALYCQLGSEQPNPLPWGNLINPQEVNAIIDAGNATIWICEGQSGKTNRRMGEEWTDAVLKHPALLKRFGFREPIKQVVKLAIAAFQSILTLPRETISEFLVKVSIPPSTGQGTPIEPMAVQMHPIIPQIGGIFFLGIGCLLLWLFIFATINALNCRNVICIPYFFGIQILPASISFLIGIYLLWSGSRQKNQKETG